MTRFGLECLAIASKRLEKYLCHVQGQTLIRLFPGTVPDEPRDPDNFIFMDWVPPQSCSSIIYPYAQTFCILTLFSLLIFLDILSAHCG